MSTKDLESILVVDDEPGLADALARVLRNIGYKVLVASTFEEAKQIITDATIAVDVAVLDIMLPGGSGLDLVKLARGREPPCSSVVITGSVEQEHRRQSVLEGVLHYLQKPFEVRDLLRTIDEAAKESRILSERLGVRSVVRPARATPVAEQPESESEQNAELTYARAVAAELKLARVEADVLTLAALGRSADSIARIRQLDANVVTVVLKRILKAMDNEDLEPAAESVRQALEERRQRRAR